jgi:PAS domain S-box-containing protein
MPSINEEISGGAGSRAPAARETQNPVPPRQPIQIDVSPARWQELVEQAPFSIQTFHPDGQVKSVNKGWERLFGVTLSDYPDYNILKDTQLEQHGIMPLIRRGFAGETLQIPPIPYVPDRGQYKGQRRWCGACIYPLRDAGGGIKEIVLVHLDMTEQRDARDKLLLYQEEREYLLGGERAARAEAERANRVKDDFLATLSHELRTPLNAILGWCQLLRAGGIARPEDLEEALDTIERNTRVQAEIISDLLDMSRIKEGKLRLELRDVDLVEVVRAAVNTVKASADAKGVKIETRIEADQCPGQAVATTGDFGRLQQVVWNLLSNGIKFTPAGGTIRITLQCPKRVAEVTVSDTGPGINAEFEPYLFERFRQADSSAARKHGGLGLGLAIVKSLVEMHGGTVGVESPGELGGATFRVRLPLDAMADQASSGESQPRPKTKTWAAAGMAPLSGLRVLAIDDEPDARKLIKRVLEMAGADVTSVSCVGEALEAMDSIRPDLVLSDVSMPGVDGYELIRCIRALGPGGGGNVPAVALTAFARPEDRQRALSSGFDEHVTKPVEPMTLVGVLARVVEQRKSPA